MALTHAQKTGLEATILAYLVAEGGRFARTVAAFKEEAALGGDGDDANLVVSGEVLEKAWTFVHCGLNNRTKTTKVFQAIDSGDLAEVQLYACVGIDAKALRFGYSANPVAEPPLLRAAFRNRLDFVQFFVESGHDKEVGNRGGASPLLMAAQEGHFAVVRYLAEHGAEKDKADNDGRTPLFKAASGGRFAVVQYLVEQGADKDKADNNGMTPLMTACWDAHVDVAECLLDGGCNLERTDIFGLTALHYVAMIGRLDLAALLFRWGANLDALCNDGETPAGVATLFSKTAFADAIRAEEIRRRDHGFKRDRSTIPGTEEYEAAKRPRIEAAMAEAVDESDDDDDDDDDDEEEG